MAEFAHLSGTGYLASSELAGFEAVKAFDTLLIAGRYWLGTGSGVDWLRVDTGAIPNPWLVTSYKIAVNTIPEPLRAPKNFTFEGSNDASTWTVLDTQFNQTGWSSGEEREFTVTLTVAYRYYRVNITANNGDATYTQIAELYLYGDGVHQEFAHISGTSYLASSEAFPPTFTAIKAFDNLLGGGQYWLGTGAGVDWLRVDAGAANAWLIGSYKIAVNTIPEPNRAPKDWTLEGSNDGSAWTTLDTRTGETGWTSGEQREFAVTGVTTLYRYYRVNITANNGDATYTQIAELYLYGDIGSAASIRQTQQSLELAQWPQNDVRATQAGLEVAQRSPPSAAVNETQAALEHVDWPPNEIWATQVCLEVAFPGFIPPGTRRNHSFIGAWMGTGHEPNASFNN